QRRVSAMGSWAVMAGRVARGLPVRARLPHASPMNPRAHETEQEAASRRLRASLLMLGCVLVFCLMDAVLKTLSAHYPAMQVAALRGMSSLPWVLVWAGLTTGLRPLLRVRWSLHLLRGAIGIMMMAAFVYALRTIRSEEHTSELQSRE